MVEGFVGFSEDVASKYVEAGAWEGVVFRQSLEEWCETSRDKVAVRTANDSATYGELLELARTAAANCARLGLRCGDRVVVQMRNDIPSLTAFFGAVCAGCIPALALHSHKRNELEHMCHVSGASACFIPAEQNDPELDRMKDGLESAIPGLDVLTISELSAPCNAPDASRIGFADPDPASPMFLLLSGGTTGLSKLIPRTHNDYLYNCRMAVERCELTESDVYLAVLPIAHNYPLANPGVLGILSVGGTAVLSSSPSPDETFSLIAKHEVTCTSLVPSLVFLWMEAIEWFSPDISSLRLVQVGGSLYTPTQYDQTEAAFGCRIQQIFGMAEGLICMVESNDTAEVARSSQGRAISPLDEIRIVGPDGSDVEPGEEGELLARGAYTINGYFANPDANKRSFTEEGFFRSGDLATCDSSGRLRITGRIKNVINRGGEKVSAEEVESLLERCPGIRAVAVAGVPDHSLGERTCAFVVCEGSMPDLSSVRGYLKSLDVADHKYPDQLVEVEELPTTAIGKVDLKRLKALLD